MIHKNRVYWWFATIVLVLGIGFLYFLESGKVDKNPRAIPVNFQLQWLDQAQFAGFYMADEQKYFDDAGLKVTTFPGSYGTKPVDLLVAGQIDIAVAPADVALTAMSEGKPVTMIAAVFRESVQCFMSKTESGIKTPHDFEGKKVGVYEGFDSENILRLYQKKYKLATIDVRPVAGNLASFVSGDIHVWPSYIFNEPVEMGLSGVETGCFIPSDFGVHYFSDTIIVSDDFLIENPNVVKRFINASQQGWAYAIKHRSETIDSMYEMSLNLTDTPSGRAVQEAMLKEVAKYVDRVADEPILSINKLKMNSMIESLEDAGILRRETSKKVQSKIDYSIVE